MKEETNLKEGCFLVSANGNIFIYNGNEDLNNKTLGAYIGVSNDGSINFFPSEFSWTKKYGCRYASEIEKQMFIERIEEETDGKKTWDVVSNSLVSKDDVRWRASYGELYMSIVNVDGLFDVLWFNDEYLEIDDNRYRSGNYFRTMEDAMVVLDEIENIFIENIFLNKKQ